ncbi:MAG: ABC-F family ATP-binding cassette domain-containing protein [Alphaproteobacteria bacterium]|nr:ABC-F family ATP-binding cassette domain-containing protein [Alphaproteobacteria bacterium]
MASTLILSVQEGSIAFGEKVIFEDLTFNIHEGDRICLVGRNGSGKTTLMNIITGVRDLDSGERWQLQGIKVGYLQQDIIPKPGQTVREFVFAQLDKNAEEAQDYKVEMVIQPLDLRPDAQMTALSGGQLRRAALARALVEEPDILLLDEPTNHLDLDVIEWLEGFVRGYHGAVICISHDKKFLENISDKVFWLDRGRLRVSPRGFSHFDDWAEMLMEQEARELANRRKMVDMESEWAGRGVKARRKRNMRRLENLKIEKERLKKDESSFRRLMRRIEVEPLDESALGSRVIAEFFKVSKTFVHDDAPDTVILNSFSYRISRGDRIGILGKNGSGKTSFLKLLTGALSSDKGKVKLAKDLTFSYFDQKRSDLVPEDTVHQNLCPNGGDYINVMGKHRHVCGYLKEFMFDPALKDQRVSTLSGGQKNRLLLAKVLANPRSLLILDEPTNDLDMETLDMLEEILSQYNGTLVVVSHDRDFLDQTVSRILAFEGDGVVDGCVGGYSDYLAYKKSRPEKGGVVMPPASSPAGKSAPTAVQKSKGRLTYKLQYELDNLPARIKVLEVEIENLEATLADPALFERDRAAFDTASQRIGDARAELESAEERWLELEDMRASAEG